MGIDDRVMKRLRQAGSLEVEGYGDELRLSVLGGPVARFRIAKRARLSDEELEELVSASHGGMPTLLVTRVLTPQRRNRLVAHDLSWVEYGTGVVHLRAPGFAVDLPEAPMHGDSDAHPDALPSLAGKAGVVVEVLLELATKGGDSGPEEDRGLVEQSTVARLSESNQGYVSRIFSSLVRLEALEEVGSGPYKKWRVKPDDLLDLWIQDGGPSPEVTPLFVWARSRQHLLRKLAALDSEMIPYAVGGVVAADLYMPTLTERPDPEVWISAALPPSALARALEGEVIESGANMWVWQAPGDPSLARAQALESRGKAERSDGLKALRLVSPPRAVVETTRGRGRAPDVAERLRGILHTSWEADHG